MGIIPSAMHRALDFVTVAIFALAPTLFGMTGRSAMLTYALAVVHLLLTLATRFPDKPTRGVIPFKVHGLVELVVGVALVALPLVRQWTGGARIFYLAIGAVILVVYALTRYNDAVAEPVAPRAAV